MGTIDFLYSNRSERPSGSLCLLYKGYCGSSLGVKPQGHGVDYFHLAPKLSSSSAIHSLPLYASRGLLDFFFSIRLLTVLFSRDAVRLLRKGHVIRGTWRRLTLLSVILDKLCYDEQTRLNFMPTCNTPHCVILGLLCRYLLQIW